MGDTHEHRWLLPHLSQTISLLCLKCEHYCPQTTVLCPADEGTLLILSWGAAPPVVGHHLMQRQSSNIRGQRFKDFPLKIVANHFILLTYVSLFIWLWQITGSEFVGKDQQESLLDNISWICFGFRVVTTHILHGAVCSFPIFHFSGLKLQSEHNYLSLNLTAGQLNYLEITWHQI